MPKKKDRVTRTASFSLLQSVFQLTAEGNRTEHEGGDLPSLKPELPVQQQMKTNRTLTTPRVGDQMLAAAKKHEGWSSLQVEKDTLPYKKEANKCKNCSHGKKTDKDTGKDCAETHKPLPGNLPPCVLLS